MATSRLQTSLTTAGKLLRYFGLLGLWLVTAAQMYASHIRDGYGTPEQFGTNLPGNLSRGLILSLIELALLYLIVWPWSSRRTGIRPLLALGVFVPWTCVWLFLTQHQGRILTIHFFWLVEVDIILALTILIDLMRAFQRRRGRQRLRPTGTRSGGDTV